MLQFIFGRPSSGKTYTIIQKIKELTTNNSKCVFIVPEQFTFESERMILKSLGDKLAQNVDVLSFTRLFDEVGRFNGGIAGRLLNNCDKIIFIKQALNNAKDDLKLWGKYTDSVNFAKTILDTIGEFKINGISFTEVRKASEKCDSSILSAKLYDISLIYEYYDAILGSKFFDPADRLTKLNNALETFKFFEGKNVFIDSFKGFTGIQFKIFEKIILQSQNVYISLVNDTENIHEFDIFTNIRKAVSNIENIAKKYNVNLSEPIILGKPRYNNKGLNDVESLISGKRIEKIEDDSSVNICRAATVADETDFVARTIKRLVRMEKYRYRDFVVIVRDEDKYLEQMAFSCKKNSISCFVDKRIPLSAFPISAAINFAISALNLSSEMILNFHKTGMGTLTTDEISKLENYILLWNIDGKMWLNDWEMNPNGFTDRNLCEDKNTEFLNNINSLRKKAVSPILKFKESFFGNAKNMATAVYKLLEECNCSEKLLQISEIFANENNNYSSDILKLSYEEYMKILDSIVICYSDKDIAKEDFFKTLNLAVSLTDVGTIPQTLDQVIFGAADRICPSRPKIAFILGANQGVFPKTVQNLGVFNLRERRNLIDNGIQISDNSLFSAIDEEFLVYRSLCCPSDKLYISYAQQSVTGELGEPATFVRSIIEKLQTDIIEEPTDELCVDNTPESINSAISEYSRKLKTNVSNALTIKTALIDFKESIKLDVIDEFCSKKQKKLSPDTAKNLFGENIRMSASKFDNYSRCHFSFFCRYGVNAKKIQPADFDVMQRGTIVHYVLERFINENKENISELNLDLIDCLTDKYINEYLDSVKGYRSIHNARLEFLVSRISRSLKDVVQHVANELKQSDFKPVACELKIGENSSLKFPFENGNIFVNGSIDRVDEYNGYIRIVDYKTGNKSFKLPDILFGLNLQMLIYLYAVTRAKGFEDSKAAGILYQPSKRDLNDYGMAMNGLLQGDLELITAMDKSLNGDYVPKLSINSDGSISKRSNSFIEPEKFTEIFDYIEKLMKKTGESITNGDIAVNPIDGRESPACKYCDYSSICGIENMPVPRVPDMKMHEVFDYMKGDQEDGV